jgi:hypothetical protein
VCVLADVERRIEREGAGCAREEHARCDNHASSPAGSVHSCPRIHAIRKGTSTPVERCAGPRLP